MSNGTTTQKVRVDQFFTVAEARFDRWRTLLQAARGWEMRASDRHSENEGFRTAVLNSFLELCHWEDFFAFPGSARLKAIQERIEGYDAPGTARLVQSISSALLTHSYRTGHVDSDYEDQSINFSERVPGAGEEGMRHRPYFEVLVVSPARSAAWPELAQELRKLRRPNDRFIYEPVFVGSFEDAILAIILNGSFEAVIV